MLVIGDRGFYFLLFVLGDRGGGGGEGGGGGGTNFLIWKAPDMR